MRNPLNLLGRYRIHAARKLTVVWGGHNYSARLHDAHGANNTALLVEFLLNRNFEFHRSRITIAQRISRPVVDCQHRYLPRLYRCLWVRRRRHL